MIDVGAAGGRRIEHPGPRGVERARVAPADFRRIRTVLPPGASIQSAVAGLMRDQDGAGGVVELSGGWLKPFRFVIPDDDPTGDHAVWYSRPIDCPDGVSIERASVSVGRYRGEPFLHCHGLWRTADGRLLGGHMLPDENLIVEPVTVDAVLTPDASFDRRYDPETNFELFSAVGAGSERGRGSGALVSVRPGEDVFEAIEAAAERAGIARGRVHGVGSTVGLALADGRLSTSLALEVFVTDGRLVAGDDGRPRAALSMAGVGFDGVPYEGALLRGRNRVCVTFELALVADDG